jgi:hypothetical protein
MCGFCRFDYITKPITALTLDKILREIITKERLTERPATIISSASGSELSNKKKSTTGTPHSSSSQSSISASSSGSSMSSSDSTNNNIDTFESGRKNSLEEQHTSQQNGLSVQRQIEESLVSIRDTQSASVSETKLRKQLESLQKIFDCFVPPQFQVTHHTSFSPLFQSFSFSFLLFFLI